MDAGVGETELAEHTADTSSRSTPSSSSSSSLSSTATTLETFSPELFCKWVEAKIDEPRDDDDSHATTTTTVLKCEFMVKKLESRTTTQAMQLSHCIPEEEPKDENHAQTSSTTTTTTRKYCVQTMVAVQTTTQGDDSSQSSADTTTTTRPKTTTTTQQRYPQATSKTAAAGEGSTTIQDADDTNNHSDSDALVIGRHTYRRPWNQEYPPAVAQWLATIQVRKKRQYQRASSSHADLLADTLEEADGYLELGLAHRTVVEEHVAALTLLSTTSSTTTTTTTTPEAEAIRLEEAAALHVRLAINAYQQSASLFQGLLQQQSGQQEPHQEEEEDTAAALLSSLAYVYFQMGEVYAISPQESQVALAQDYLVQSDALYRNIISKDDERREQQQGTKDADKGGPGRIMDDYSRRQVLLNWAFCSMRLGVHLLEGGSGKGAMEALILQQQQFWNDPSVFGDDPSSSGGSGGGAADAAEKTAEAYMENWKRNVEWAESLFAQAERILKEEASPQKTKTTGAGNAMMGRQARQAASQERRALQSQWATSLQNLATAFMLQGQLEKSASYGERALEIYQSILSETGDTGRSEQDQDVELYTAVAEQLYGLADCYLQQGQYEKSKDRYQKAMDWYTKYSDMIPNAAATEEELAARAAAASAAGTGGEEETNLMFAETKKAIEDYEQLLQEYLEMFGGDGQVGMEGSGYYSDESPEEEMYYFERDPAYEGDLHQTLGALYMSVGDGVTAGSHLYQALALYQQAGEQEERTMADVQYNLALLHFQHAEYDVSAQMHEDALDLYQAIVGDGVNPFTEGLDQGDEDDPMMAAAANMMMMGGAGAGAGVGGLGGFAAGGVGGGAAAGAGGVAGGLGNLFGNLMGGGGGGGRAASSAWSSSKSSKPQRKQPQQHNDGASQPQEEAKQQPQATASTLSSSTTSSKTATATESTQKKAARSGGHIIDMESYYREMLNNDTLKDEL